MEGNVELTAHSFWFYWFALFGLILFRYFLIAGGSYFLFYRVLKKYFTQRGVNIKSPLPESARKDIQLSILSGLIFAFFAGVIVSSYDLGLTIIYTDPFQYGRWYLVGSFIFILLLQDTYFYFIHRLFHHRFLFKWLHRGHHNAIVPTPWTSFAFDPPEALIQGIFLLAIVFLLPIHVLVLIAILMTMTIWSIINHLGFELFPSPSPYHWFSRWFIGAKHHLIHHQKYNIHYGLYFTFWDRLLGTQEPNYDKSSHVN